MDLDFLTLPSSSPDSQMDLMTIMMSMEKQLTDPNLASSSTGQTPILSDPMATYPDNLSFTSDHFQQPPGLHHQASVAAMREMIFRIASMQPIHIDPETVKPSRRRNVKISKDPQSVAARHRRERISEKMRILQRLVPGGTKMDTASMLDEAIHYVKFLKAQVQSLEMAAASTSRQVGMGFPLPAAAAVAFASGNYSCYALQPPDQMYVNTSTNTHKMLR